MQQIRALTAYMSRSKEGEETMAMRSASVRRTVAALLAASVATTVAHAQEAGETQEGREVTEVMVTGTRLRIRDGMETPTPVTAVEIEEINTLGPGNLVEAMNQMPQFLNNSSPANVGSISGPLGSSVLNLRGVGSNRTLVLLDGRRVASSNRLGVTDIAMFPEAVIRGMEVVTGGASAAYGSDAVSGVVNYLLDTSFTGFKGSLQGGITERSDNENVEASLAAGWRVGERGHIIASAEYFRAHKVETYEDRDWYQNWGTVDVNGPGRPTVVASNVRARTYTAGGLIRLPGSQLDMIHFLHGGIPARFEDGTLVGATRQVGGTPFYVHPTRGEIASKHEDQTGQGSLFPDTERGSAFFHATYDFDGNWEGYLQYLYGSNEIDFVGTGAHQETTAWRATIYRDNAFLPQSIAEIMDAEGRTEFPLYRYASSMDLSRNRGAQLNQLNSYTTGIRGSINDIRINAYYQYGTSSSQFTATNYPRLDRLYRAMDAVVDPATGNIVCRSTLSFPDDGCVPANPFGPGTMSQEAIDYILEGQMYRRSILKQHFAEISADTTIFENWGPGAISVAAGVSYRDDSFRQRPGPAELVEIDVLPAETQGYRGLPATFVGESILQFAGIDDQEMSGRFDVYEVFAETLVPLLRDRPFMQAVDFSAAIRHAEYSGSGGVLAWKAGLDWRLNDQLRLRVTRSRDTRAATLSERFDRSTAGTTAYDPVIGDTYSFSQIIGGNPTVEPELGDTWTIGAVIQPSFLPNFAFSADWYDIQISDYITQLGAQRIIDDCFAGAADLCQRITRGDNGDITWVENVFLNVAEARVTGVDMEASYRRPITLFGGGPENLSVRLFASYLKENSFTIPGVPTRNDAGSTNLPKWTGTAIVTYTNGPFTGSFTGRYIDSRVQFTDPTPAQQMDDNSVSSVFYANLRLSYRFEQLGSADYDVFLNVQNLFDRDPPVVASWSDFFGASATTPALHDTLGRRYLLGVSVAF